MLHRHTLGSIPPKPHTTHYVDGKLMMEQCMTREGFDGPFSILYFKVPPTDECATEPASIAGCPTPCQARDGAPGKKHCSRAVAHRRRGSPRLAMSRWVR